jgi:hypothetical protein
MSFTALDPELVIDPFTVSSFTGVDQRSGVFLDVDGVNSSILVKTNDTPVIYAENHQAVGINTINPKAQLDVNAANGACLQLTYNGSETNKANVNVSSDGKMILASGGSEVNVDAGSNFNVKSHNGTTTGLMLNGTLVRATADQVNYTTVTPGTAAVSKALVVDAAKDITGVRYFTADQLTGQLQTAAQPNVESVTILDVTGHSGAAGLKLNGTLVTSTAAQLNYTNVTPGQATESKALVFDESRDISNINSLTATSLTGQLQTAAQPNITSVGTLNALDLAGNLTGLTHLSVATSEASRSLVVNSDVGSCARFYYDADTNTDNYTDLLVNSAGHLILTSSGGNVDISTHDGSTVGLKLGSVLVTATADQINYLEGTTTGSATQGKALIVDSSRSIGNINSLTATSLTGQLQTAAQPNISSVAVLDITTHNGTTAGLKLNGTLVTSTATELNYTKVTPGAAEASKALVLDSSSDISGINSLSASLLTGEIQTASQPNITSFGTLTSIATSGDITVGTTVISETDIAKIDGITNGTAAVNKALVLSGTGDISGINNFGADFISGQLQTANQPNINSVDVLDIAFHDGATQGLSLDNELVVATAGQLNYTTATPGTASASKAIILDSAKDITGIHYLTADQLTGQLQTASQPNITSVGTLVSLTTSGTITVGSTVISETDIAKIDGITNGTAAASKALILDGNFDISGINSLSSTTINTTNIYGTVQTAYQPSITSVDVLDITAHNGTTQGLRLGGELLTVTASQLNSVFGGSGGNASFSDVGITGTLDVTGLTTLANVDVTDTATIENATINNYLTVNNGMTAYGGDSSNSSSGAIIVSGGVGVSGSGYFGGSLNTKTLNLTGTYTDEVFGAFATLSGPTAHTSLAYNGSGIIIVANSNSTTLYVSSNNGVSFSNSSALPSSAAWFGHAYDPTLNKFLITSTSGVSTVGNSTATTWSAATTIPSVTATRHAKYLSSFGGGGIVVLSGGDNKYAFTNDAGTTWSTYTLGITVNTSSAPIEISTINALFVPTNATTTQVNYSYTNTLGNASTGSISGSFETGSQCYSAFSPTLDRLVVLTTAFSGTANRFYYMNSPTTTKLGNSTGWVAVNSPISSIWGHCEWIPSLNVFIASAGSDSTKYIWSSDGITWNASNTPVAYAFSQGQFIVTSSNVVYAIAFGNINYAQLYDISAAAIINFNNSSISEYDINKINNITPGTAASLKALIVDANLNITNIGSLTATNLYGTARTAAQPYITSVGTLTGLAISGAISNTNSTDSTSTTTGAIITSGGIGVAKNVYVGNNVNIAGSIVMGSTSISSAELAVIDTVTAGSATANKALIVDSSRNISNINSIASITNTLTSTFTNTFGSSSTASSHATGGIAYSSTLGLFVSTVTTSSSSNYYTSTDGSTWTLRTNLPSSRIWTDVVWMPNTSLFIIVGGAYALYSSTGTSWTEVSLPISNSARLMYTTTFTRAVTYNPGSGEFAATTDGINWTRYTNTNPNNSFVSIVEMNNELWFGVQMSFNTITFQKISGTFGNFGNDFTISFANNVQSSYALAYSPTINTYVILGGSSTNSAGMMRYQVGSGGMSNEINLPVAGQWNYCIWVTEINAFVAVSRGSSPKMIYSNNGITWYSVTGFSGNNTHTILWSASQNKLYVANVGVDVGSISATRTVVVPAGLTIDSITITESELSPLDSVTPGTVSASKAVVVNADKDISSFRNLTAVNLTGTIQTAAQPNITSFGTLTSIATSGDITVGSTVISETDIAKIDAITNGAAAASKALILDSSLDITGINSLTASLLTGEIQTAAQPNITSVGILTSLTVSGDLECDGNLIVGGTIISESEIVHLDGATPGTAEALKAMITDENNDISGVNHFGSTTLTLTTGPFVVGTTSLTETELTRIDGLTNGTAAASKALVLDGSLNITGINSLSASLLTGTIQTAAQSNITSVGTLTSIATSGDITVGSTVISETDIAKIDAITNGTAAASKALILDSSLDIAGINSLSASLLTGEIQTAAQPNITSVGTLTSIATSGDITVGSTVISETDIAKIDAITNGTAAASKALILDTNLDITGINSLSASQLTGTIQTAAQPNITSVGTLTSIATSGSVTVGSTVISETDIAKIDAITNGTAAASKALVLDTNLDITGINALTASLLTGEIQTATQPNITSVGTLTSITTSGSVTVGSTVISETDIAKIDAITNGTAAASKVLVLDTNLDITGINNLTSTHLICGDISIDSVLIDGTDIAKIDAITNGTAAANKALVLDTNLDISGINSLSASLLTGTIQTAAQPNISSVDILDITQHNGTTQGLSLGGVLLTVTAAQLNSVFGGAGGDAMFANIEVTDDVDISGHNGVDTGLSLNGVLVTATATELNYVDVVQGAAAASKALVLDSSLDIAGINSLSASLLTGEIQTAAQPNITSVGTLTSIATSGSLTVGSTVISETDIAKIDAITNGTAAASKALVLDSNLDIAGINKIGAAVLAIGTPANSDLKLEVGSSSYVFGDAYAYHNDSNALGVIDAGNTTPMAISARFDGRVIVTGEVMVTSDKRLKTNIDNLDAEFAKSFIQTTTPVRFNWKSGDEVTEYGYIAQDVYKAGFTDIVVITPHPGLEEIVEDDGFVNPKDAKFTLSTGKIIPLLALNQKSMIEELEQKDAKIASLEAMVASLISRMESVESLLQ